MQNAPRVWSLCHNVSINAHIFLVSYGFDIVFVFGSRAKCYRHVQMVVDTEQPYLKPAVTIKVSLN